MDLDFDHWDRVITAEEIDPIATPAGQLADWLVIEHDLSLTDALAVVNEVRARTLATRAASGMED